MNFEYFIALKQITHRKGIGFISLISFISVAGIAVGVMALIVVLSVMSGFDRELKSKIIGANPHILIVQAGGIENAQDVVSKVNELQLPEITSIAPYVEGQVIIRSETNATGSIIKGVSEQDHSVDGIRSYIKDGAIESVFEKKVSDEGDSEPQQSIALGYQIARILRVSVGDAVQVISPYLEHRGPLLPKRAKTVEFTVGAIFELGMNTMDTSLTLVSHDAAQELFNLEGRSSGIAIRLSDEFKADELKKVIRSHLGYPFWTQSWIDMNKSFFSALKVEKNVMTVLLSLIILVAGFNIVSTLIMVVMDKTKDIGILKAIGATKQSISQIFLLQSSIVGILGVSVGATLGFLITFNLNTIADYLESTFGFEVFPSDIYYFNEIPTQVNFTDIGLIIVAALAISIVAGWYPARRAAGLHPVEALRYE